MDFSAALELLKDGRRMARRSWVQSGTYVYVEPESPRITPDNLDRTLEAHLWFDWLGPHGGLVPSTAPIPRPASEPRQLPRVSTGFASEVLACPTVRALVRHPVSSSEPC